MRSVSTPAGASESQSFDPIVVALAQLVRDRYATERAISDNVVALRRVQSKGRNVGNRSGATKDGSG